MVMAEWNFFVFIDSNDRDVVSDWLDVLPLKASAKIRQILWNQRLFAVWEKRFCKSLKGHKGLYELRISRQRAQFRLLGFFGPEAESLQSWMERKRQTKFLKAF